MRLFFFLFLINCQNVYCQNCNEQLQLSVKEKSLRLINDTSCLNSFLLNSGQSLLLWKVAIVSSDTLNTQNITLQLSKFGFSLETLLTYVDSNYRSFFENAVYKNPYISKKYSLELDSINRLPKYYSVKLIESLYSVDQTLRIVYRNKMTKETFLQTLGIVDSLNFMILADLIMKDSTSIFDSKIGFSTSERLYIIFLHSSRDISEPKFNQLVNILYKLVQSRQFNPFYYANIIDERARYSESRSYPIYNFLKLCKDVNEEQIEANRLSIGAFRLE